MATYPTLPPGNTLAAIQQKVRRMTRSPSEAQLTTDDLNNYINTFVMYDFPEHLRTFNLRTTFTFYTNPYQDEYFTDTASFGDVSVNPTIANNPLYNFQNKYISVHDPVYIAGYQSVYTQSREQFFGMYPKINSIASIGQVGDGVTTSFTGVINTNQAIVPTNFTQKISLLQRQVLFDSADTFLNGLQMVDVPIIDVDTGNPTVTGVLYNPYSAQYKQALLTPPTSVNFDPNNTIDYADGTYTVTFLNADGVSPIAPGPGQPINSQTVLQQLAIPMAVLYYANKFVVRPVPDQVYRVQVEVYQRPSQLLQSTSVPQLEEWWQFLALGSAIKILQDRVDMDTVNLLMPEYRNQMNLCNRRSIVQYTNERVATIYTESTGINGGFSGWGNGTGSF